MKIMYVAANPAGGGELMIDREITELLRRFLTASGEPVEFIPCPSLPIEEFPLELAKHKPDILHISAHGDEDVLMLSNADGKPVVLNAATLLSYLNMEHPPTLVYLNACNSKSLAKSLVRVVPMAIGTTAPITNRTARASALLFYDRILNGLTVRTAFEAGKATIEALHLKGASSVLCSRNGVNPARQRLHMTPRILAHFTDDRFECDANGFYSIEIGVSGCPSNTSFVVFFTDDETFIDDDTDIDNSEELATDLCRVVRTTAIKSVMWDHNPIYTYGDYRLFVTGVTAAGIPFSVRSTLCDALDAYFALIGSDPIPPEALDAIKHLRSMDGSLGPTAEPIPQKRQRRAATTGSPKSPRAVTAQARKQAATNRSTTKKVVARKRK